MFLQGRCFKYHEIGLLPANCKNSALCSKCDSLKQKWMPNTPCQKVAFVFVAKLMVMRIIV